MEQVSNGNYTERSHLLTAPVDVNVKADVSIGPPNWELYNRRWYLLLVYCVLSTQQSVLWITFSPVAKATKSFYHTNDFMVNLLLAWGAIIYIPFLFFGGYIMNRKGGLRRIILLGAILDGIGGSIRCLSILNPTAWWALPIVSFGQILNAAAGPLVMASPSKLSATWFGENERTAVTCVATLANQLGSALGFIYSSYVVEYTSLPVLLYIQGGFSVFIMIWVLVYFPEKPPTPPSASASVSVDNATDNQTRLSTDNFLSEMYTLLFHGPFMLLALVGGYATGAFNAWSGMFDIILGPLGYDQTFCGWLGFSSTLAGIVGGITLGFLGNTIFARRFKLLIVLLFVLSSIFFVYFSLSLPSIFSIDPLIPSNRLSIIVSVTLGGLFLGSANPIFLELGAEITFPIQEGSSAGMITLINNIAGLIVLLVGPYIPYNWINSLVAFSMAVCGIGMVFVREKYLRKDFDAVPQMSINKA